MSNIVVNNPTTWIIWTNINLTNGIEITNMQINLQNI